MRARVVPNVAGPLQVCADATCLTLEVRDPAGWTLPPPARLGRQQLVADVNATACFDDAFPRLAGEWLLYCKDGGLADRARNLADARDVELPFRVRSPVVDGGWILDPASTRAVELGGGLSEREAFPAERIEGQGATARGAERAVATPNAMHWDLRKVDAQPLPDGAPALAEGWLVWGERRESRDLLLAWNGSDAPLVLTETSDRARLPVAEGPWVAWYDGPDVRLERLGSGERRRFAAAAGFRGGITLSGGVACWEDRGALRAGGKWVELRCSNGATVRAGGHALAPSLAADRLLWRVDRQLWWAPMEAP